ncbi:MAG: hypothetical protein ACREBC_36100 [Pyrinomonadaceae bacterium]
MASNELEMLAKQYERRFGQTIWPGLLERLPQEMEQKISAALKTGVPIWKKSDFYDEIVILPSDQPIPDELLEKAAAGTPRGISGTLYSVPGDLTHIAKAVREALGWGESAAAPLPS